MATSQQEDKIEDCPVTDPMEDQANVSQAESVCEETLPHDGHLMKIFNMAAEKCIDKCLNAKNWKQFFGKSYKPVWSNNKEMLETIVQEVLLKTKVNINKEIQMFMEQENLPAVLAEVEKLLHESRNTDESKVAWRPTGDPELDSTAHVVSAQQEILENYQLQLQKTQQEEEILRKQVIEGREQLYAVQSQIKSLLEKERSVGDIWAKFEQENEEKMNFLISKTKDLANSP